MMAETAASTSRFDAESLFDDVGFSYEQAFSSCPGLRASIDRLKEHLSPNATVLDIGCGTGRPVCSDLAAAGHSVLGIDISKEMVDAASRLVPDARFEKVNIKNDAPSGENKYDAITAYLVLIIDFTQQEIKDAIYKLCSWLKPGGILVLSTLPIDGNNMELKWMGRPITVSGFSQEGTVKLLENIGLEVLTVDRNKFLPEGVAAGLCKEEDVWEEDHMFVHARK